MEAGTSKQTKSPKGVNKNGKKTPNPQKMSPEEIQAALLKKRECELRAFKIVERLIENPVPAHWFIYSLRYISLCHLEDIFEERSIMKQCGYPICNGVIKISPKQQYSISTKNNKVYDITDRKKFCTNKCYKAGIFVKEQMLSSPLWLRDKEEIPEFKLLSWDTPGLPGLEVQFGISKMEIEPTKFTSIGEFCESSISDEIPDTFEDINQAAASIEEEKVEQPPRLIKTVKKVAKEGAEIKINRKIIESKFAELIAEDEQFRLSKHQLKMLNICDKNHKEESIKISVESVRERLEKRKQAMAKLNHKNNQSGIVNKIETSPEKVTSELENQVTREFVQENPTESKNVVEEIIIEEKSLPNVNKLIEGDITNLNTKINEISLNQLDPKNRILTSTELAIKHVELCLTEWFTIDSLIYIYGENRVRKELSQKELPVQELLSKAISDSKNYQMNEAYAQLCKKIDLLEIEENRESRSKVDLKPLPDYRMLKADNKRLMVKVRSFYHGSLEYADDASESEIDSDDDEEELEQAPVPAPPVVPTIDKSGQIALRRRIVCNSLNKILPGLLQTFGLTSHDMGTEIRQLINTFHLTAKNIIFKPMHLNLLGLIVTQILAAKNRGLAKLLEENTSIKYTNLLLGIYKLPSGYVTGFVAELFKLENIVKVHCKILH